MTDKDLSALAMELKDLKTCPLCDKPPNYSHIAPRNMFMLKVWCDNQRCLLFKEGIEIVYAKYEEV